jgi:WD40 repeat protein/energy-coupling factor transporter ATP-binding protein EcfA2
LEKPRYDVFLSHATRDKPVVEELARLLKKAGFEPWLDKWNLIPGEPWQEAIEKALEECATCAVCLGPSGTGPWQNEEMRAAIDARVSDRSRHFRVIPVLLPHSERGEPSRLPAFLRATTWVEFRDTLGDENALHRLIRGIQGAPPGPDPGEAVAEGAQPYRGLQVFDVADALFFFGREALTEWLLDKLRTDRTGNRFLAIVGPSGSGKSSLARAGLLAALKRGEISGSDAWPAAICKPGEQPLESLAVALSGAARLGDSPSAVRDLIRDLGADPRMLHLTTRLALRDAPADRRLVVLVDQFEEVFTLCPDEAQRQAIIANLLYAATAADGQTLVVLTLRADFYGRCAAYPDLATAVSDRQSLVGPMTRDELRSAIERPAYLAGCELEGGLTDLLMNEVESQPNSLPLLEHALLQIWQRREGGRRLTIDAYHEVGGVAGALEKHAEEVFSGLTEAEGEICRRVFLRLVQVDEQGRATKRRLEELPGEGVISRLTTARLLTTDREKRPTVEVAHEALLANWERLKQWIEQDREALRIRRRLDEAVAEWIGKARDSSFLLEGGRLAQAEEWAAGHAGEVGPETREFLKGSVDERDRGRGRQRKLTLVACVIAAVAIIAALTAVYSWHRTKNQLRIALAGNLSERSKTAFAVDPQLGLLLATQALKIARDAGEPYLPSAQSALRWALAKSGGTPLSSGPVDSTFITPDRHLLATIGEDRHLRTWDLRANTLPFPDRDLGEMPKASHYTITGSPSGRWLLVADEKGSWLLDSTLPGNVLTRAVLLEGEDWIFGHEPFSPNGRWLATRKNQALLLRDLTAPGASPTTLLQNTDVSAFGFSPDSLTLATASAGGLVQLWALKLPPQALMTSKIPEEAGVVRINLLAFSQDGQILVATQPGMYVNTWWIQRDGRIGGPDQLKDCIFVGQVVQRAQELLFLGQSLRQRSGIWSAQPGVSSKGAADWDFEADTMDFSSDGSLFATGDRKGNVYLQRGVNLNGRLGNGISTQASPINGVAFSASSRWLLTQGGDEAPRLWDLSVGPAIADFEPRIFRSSAPEMLIVTAKGEIVHDDPDLKMFRLWTLAGKPSSAGFPGSKGAVAPRAVSAEGRWYAAASPNQSLLLWQRMPDGKVSSPISLGNGTYETLSFSPGGHWLVACETNGKVSLWNLRDIKSPPGSLTTLDTFGPVAFTSGDDLVATAGSTIHLRALGEKGPALADAPHSPSTSTIPNALAFSADNQWLAIGGKADRIRVWGFSGREIYLENRSDEVDSFAFSPDGQWLAAGGRDGTIQLWRWAEEQTTPTPILLTGYTAPVYSVAFTPQGLMSASWDGTVRLWELRPDKLVELACQSAGRTLRKSEWSTYLVTEPYERDEPCPGMPKAPDVLALAPRPAIAGAIREKKRF